MAPSQQLELWTATFSSAVLYPAGIVESQFGICTMPAEGTPASELAASTARHPIAAIAASKTRRRVPSIDHETTTRPHTLNRRPARH
jgi:hypothetical protein